MAEIFRKLKGLEFQWKIITPYFIRCKSVKQPMCTFIVIVPQKQVKGAATGVKR